MTIKLLIVDPEIGFAIPVKRALEDSGDYTVSVFANGMAAVEFCQREKQDVAILDFRIGDMSLPRLIKALRAAQPDLFILSSPRTIDDVAEQPLLDVQGSISKPYFARQLVPVIKEALATKARQQARKTQTQERAAAAAAAASQAPASIPEIPPAPPATIPEPPVEPDDTFHRLTAAGNSQPVQTVNSAVIEEPEIDDEATIRDLVSGQSTPTPTVPLTVPEVETPDSGVAMLALDAASDDRVLLEDIALPKFIDRLEQALEDTGASRPVPAWTSNPSVVEPAIFPEDTQPSERLRVAMLVPPVADGDTEPTAHEVEQAEEVADEDQDEQEAVEAPVVDSADELDIEITPSAPPEPYQPVEPQEPVEAAVAPEVSVVATLAVQLTQLTVDLAAEATFVTQDNTLVASAGDLPDVAIAGVVDTINAAWQDSTERGGSLVRFIHVPGLGDYLLYSIPTIENMILSMLFPAETPLKVIRKQARELMSALERVPDLPAESEAAKTLISRPTDLRPPHGLRQAVEDESDVDAQGDVIDEAAAERSAEAQSPRAEGPYTAYAFVWLPRHDTLDTDTASALLGWIDNVAKSHAWQLEGTDIQPSYVSVQVSIPANETPTATVESLMHETSGRAENDDLWADAYYIVAPGRAVTEQEIASFMEYRRDAQDAA